MVRLRQMTHATPNYVVYATTHTHTGGSVYVSALKDQDQDIAVGWIDRAR